MKSCSTLLVALGLVSSTVLAQSVQPAPDASTGRMPEAGSASPPAAEGQMPAPVMESGIVVIPVTPQEDGELSSGAPGAQTTRSGGGQLITPEIAQSRPAADTTGISVEPQTANGITYLCGGIGEEESDYMKQTAAKDYDLMMTFAEKSGNYVADVNVSIRDARGKTVLETKCDAPILLVDLPAAGNYRIQADAAGREMDRTASVRAGKGRAKQVTFVWPTRASAVPASSERAGSTSSGGDDYYGTERYGTESSGSESAEGESSGGESGNEDFSGENMR